MNYEAFEKIQKKVAEVEASIEALSSASEGKHATAIDVLRAEIDNLKSSLGGKKRRKRTVAKATEPKAARKKPGPKPKTAQAAS